MSKSRISTLFNKALTRPLTAALMVFGFLFIILALIVNQRYLLYQEDEKAEMAGLLNVAKESMDNAMKGAVTATLTLALTIDESGTPRNFDSVAHQVYISNPMYKTLQLVPGGVIKYVYPLKGNEAVLNYDIINNSPQGVKEEAFIASKTNKVYFAGPIKLKQGGIGIVGRLPVTINNRFWGYSAVVIKADKFLEKVRSVDSAANKYVFQLSKKNPATGKEEFYLTGITDFRRKQHLSAYFPEGGWTLHIIKIDYTPLFIKIIIPLLFGLLLAILCAMLIAQIVKKTVSQQEFIHQQAKKLIDNELRFTAIFDQALIGIALADVDSLKFSQVNDSFCQLLGYTRRELLQLNLLQIETGEESPDIHEIITGLKSGRYKEYIFEDRCRRKDAMLIWCKLHASALLDQDGNMAYLMIFVQDISDRKSAEKAISKSEKRFRELFDNSPVALWEEDFSEVKKHLQDLGLMGLPLSRIQRYFKDHPEAVQECMSKLRIIDFNKQCMILHGAASREDLLRGFGATLPESRSSITDQLVAICQGVTHYTSETEIKTLSGETKHTYVNWNVLPGYEKSLDRVILAVEDVSSLKQSERIISESQQRIETLINNIDGIVWEADAKTFAFTYMSKKSEEILGYPAEDWLSSPTFWSEHIHPDDRHWVVNYCIEKTNKLEKHDFEYRMLARNGETVWMRDIVSVHCSGNEPDTLRGIMIDITEQKKASIELNKSFTLVSEQNKRLLNFSYIVSHNLRSHTSNIRSLINLIQVTEDAEERSEFIRLLKNVSDSLNDTMKNLNEVVNIQTNVELVITRSNLHKAIEKTLKVLSEVIAAKKARIENRVDRKIFIEYNPAYLESILLNFISNALKYSDPQRKPVVILQTTQEEGYTVLHITDNGIGIDLAKYRDQLFGLYKTVGNMPDSRGVGLFISKNQIDVMGGKVEVESEPGKGSTFKIYFA